MLCHLRETDEKEHQASGCELCEGMKFTTRVCKQKEDDWHIGTVGRYEKDGKKKTRRILQVFYE